MSRKIFGTLVAVAAVVALGWAVQRFALGHERQWTTSSGDALAAFDAGIEAKMRLYASDAATDFRNALAVDPDFVSAKVQLAEVTADGAERRRLREEIGAANMSRLTDRERFLVEMTLAAGEPAKQKALVARALEELPRDPWVLSVAAARSWDAEQWDVAGAYYRRLLEIDPNWISAHNSLGYMAMWRERFAESEEHFRTYAYIAPDQANPHDSLGELLSLRGRYSEARTELETALRVKPDFCASYVTLAGVAIFEGDPLLIPALAERASKNCPEKLVAGLECEAKIFAAYRDGDADRPWREGFIDCAGKPGDRGILAHRLALLSGRDDEARAEERSSEKPEMMGESMGGKARRYERQANHMAGVRALLEGKNDEAVAHFRAADENAAYWGAAEGRFKLFNLMHLALALERTNDAAGAARALEEVQKVNAPFAEHYAEIVGDLR